MGYSRTVSIMRNAQFIHEGASETMSDKLQGEDAKHRHHG